MVNQKILLFLSATALVVCFMLSTSTEAAHVDKLALVDRLRRNAPELSRFRRAEDPTTTTESDEVTDVTTIDPSVPDNSGYIYIIYYYIYSIVMNMPYVRAIVIIIEYFGGIF